MNKQTFIQLLQNPHSINEQQLIDLEKLIADFPYCQAAHILIAKYHNDAATMHAAQKTKKAAAYCVDRGHLKKLLKTSYPNSSIPKLAEPIPQTKDSQPPVNISTTEVHPTNLATKKEQKENIGKDELQTSENVVPEKQPENTMQDILTGSDLLDELQKNLLKAKEMKSIREAFLMKDTDKNLSGTEVPIATDSNKEKENQLSQNDITVVEAFTENNSTTNQDIPENSIQLSENISEQNNFNNNSPDKEDLSIVEETLFEQPHTVEAKLFESGKETEQKKPELHNTFVQSNEIETAFTSETASKEMQLMLEYLSYLDSKRNLFRKSKKKEDEIINKVIQEMPTMPKLNLQSLPENPANLAERSSTITKNVASENYAKILALQGKRDKAIEVYNQLILKFPEKKTYFETQIEKLKK
ncbi:MAG: hypothetical protein NZ529_06500 [Cytophagaceae bacterium]|nr:hypothetical protein [Cytophagaceae bacterium]MDW8456429.1 hypothetical protein [Cytophagaceae bacterium]